MIVPVHQKTGNSAYCSKEMRYLYGEVVDQILAQEDLSKTLGDANRTLWPLVDNLGTVRDLAKQDGTIAVHYKYDSFGTVTSGDTSKTRYLFTSREFDTATDLQYNRTRWYDAQVGRWLSEDLLRFIAADANLSRYVSNSSIQFVDPSGLARSTWPYGPSPDDDDDGHGWEGEGDWGRPVFEWLPDIRIDFERSDPPSGRNQIAIGGGIDVEYNDGIDWGQVPGIFGDNLLDNLADRFRPYLPDPGTGDQPGGDFGTFFDLLTGAIGGALTDTFDDVVDPKVKFDPGGIDDWITTGAFGGLAGGLFWLLDNYTPIGGFDFELPLKNARWGPLEYGTYFGREDGNYFTGAKSGVKVESWRSLFPFNFELDVELGVDVRWPESEKPGSSFELIIKW